MFIKANQEKTKTTLAAAAAAKGLQRIGARERFRTFRNTQTLLIQPRHPLPGPYRRCNPQLWQRMQCHNFFVTIAAKILCHKIAISDLITLTNLIENHASFPRYCQCLGTPNFLWCCTGSNGRLYGAYTCLFVWKGRLRSFHVSVCQTLTLYYTSGGNTFTVKIYTFNVAHGLIHN